MTSFADELLTRGEALIARLPGPRDMTDRVLALAVRSLSAGVRAYSIGDAAIYRLLSGGTAAVQPMLQAIHALTVPAEGVWIEFVSPDLPTPGTARVSGLLLENTDGPGGAVRVFGFAKTKKGQLVIQPGVVTIRPTGDTCPPDRTAAEWAARRAQIAAHPAVTALPEADRDAAVETMDRLQAGLIGAAATKPADAPFSAGELEQLADRAKLAVMLLEGLRAGTLMVEDPEPGGRVPVRRVSLPTAH